MQLTGSKAYFGMGTDLHNTYDIESGELRLSKLQDVVNAAKIIIPLLKGGLEQ